MQGKRAAWAWVIAVWALALSSTPARAELDHIEVLERGLVADGKVFGNTGPYERLRGKLYFAVEATAAENQAVVDLRATPRDAQGRVHFLGGFRRPHCGRSNPARAQRPPCSTKRRTDGNVQMLTAVVRRWRAGKRLVATAAQAEHWLPDGARLCVARNRLELGCSAGRGSPARADLPLASDGGKPLYGLGRPERSPRPKSRRPRQPAYRRSAAP